MSFGNILNQLMKQGIGGETQNRVSTSARNLGAGGGPVDGIFAQLQGALGGGAGAAGGAAGASGGFADRAREFMTKDQVGGMSGAQLGGIGAVAGALLGGGVGGAARGGALAMLGTLALSALKNAQAKGATQGQGQPIGGEALTLEPQEVAAVTGPAAEKLMVRAMISAAKADGQIDQAEMQKIIGKVGDEGVSAEERAFVMSELAAPVDVAALAAEARSPAQAAEVYAASLIAIDVDSASEKAYLRSLAEALRLDAATVAQLHQMTGAPAV